MNHRQWRIYDNTFEVSRLPGNLKTEYLTHKGQWPEYWLSASATPIDNLSENQWSEPKFREQYQNYAEYRTARHILICHVFTAELYEYDHFGLPVQVQRIITTDDNPDDIYQKPDKIKRRIV